MKVKTLLTPKNVMVTGDASLYNVFTVWKAGVQQLSSKESKVGVFNVFRKRNMGFFEEKNLLKMLLIQ